MLAFFKEIFTRRPRYSRGYILALCVSILAALAVGAGIMLLTGYNPIECYAALVKGVFGSARTIGDTLAKSVTLCLTGLAMAVAAKAGMFNVGGEGQLYLGAVASAAIGFAFAGTSPFLAVPLAFICAMLAGGAYAVVPALLKVKLNISEVITTIMLNTAAISFCAFLANGPLKTAEPGIASGTPAIDAALRFSSLVPLSNLTESLFYAAVIAVLVWLFMSKTVQGYEMKLTGQNPRFASYMGIKTNGIAVWAMAASGAICGLVGMFEVFGIHGRFVEAVSAGYYFDGMLIAMIMRYNPIGIIVMSLFFGALRIGSSSMELHVGLSNELILVVQSIIIFFMAAEDGILRAIREKRAQRLGKGGAD